MKVTVYCCIVICFSYAILCLARAENSEPASESASESSEVKDIDECFLNTDNCDVNAECQNTAGSFQCICNAGYSGDGVSCTDVDECLLNTDNCNVNAACQNTEGSFQCSCNVGYSGDGVSCTDIDECLLNADNCDENAACQNTAGSFECNCNAGYSGDGVSCTDINECLLNTDDCDANAACQNIAGGFQCICNAGFSGDGVSCTDIDECLLNTDNCDVNAECQNTEGSFQCICNAGYSGDGVSCTEVQICESESQGCESGWFYYCGRCYLIIYNDVTWFGARDDCINKGGYLVEIDSIGEKDFVKSQVLAAYAENMLANRFWIGLTDISTELEYVWIGSGSVPSFTFFFPDGTSNADDRDCVVMNLFASFYWSFNDCSRIFNYICEKDAH